MIQNVNNRGYYIIVVNILPVQYDASNIIVMYYYYYLTETCDQTILTAKPTSIVLCDIGCDVDFLQNS